eukprot:CAMPEP_0178455508 /NCGR_PEP_ID=MMETSP0689_2-20121128/45950_1 /TAXON_ID=160604 /ORGANISM="Amphidinium massartii, Strain CS-259" /LENGTH=235 /DNA_ID=CAMNT_0020081555 /DNA_START=21 /DNA_END=729 /DNA_ORIENTATION=+
MPLFNLFGSGNTAEARKESNKEVLREWQRKLRSEIRTLERSIRKIEQEEEKLKRQAKQMAKEGGDKQAITMLAKSLVRSRKAKDRLYTCRSVMSSTCSELSTIAATMSLADSMQKSTMQQVNSLVNVPELHESITEMQKEMMKAGLIEEMMDEGMEAMDMPDMEEQTAEEIDKILDELAVDASYRLAQGAASTAPVKQGDATKAAEAAPPQEQAAESARQKEDDELMKRLQALQA